MYSKIHLGGSEVAQLHHPAIIDKDIASLDVAMNHALVVQIHEALQDLLGVAGHPSVGKGAEVDEQSRHGPRHPLLKN